MKRIGFSAAGLIMTIAWIVYTAPAAENKISDPKYQAIELSERSGQRLPENKSYVHRFENDQKAKAAVSGLKSIQGYSYLKKNKPLEKNKPGSIKKIVRK